ncbi:MAG: M61 family metallopeptidase [Leptospiraceae bacterium]|nr:M61 family metallopeptidase [Leptospiraceae bacterium]MCP5494721.1 M61 family metallopeptidase [Leptospiraceae bacterium]
MTIKKKKSVISKKPKESIHYKIKIQQPHLHYYHVELKMKVKAEKIVLTMPSWSPGSYVIRNYSGLLHKFEACLENGKAVPWKELNLEQWEILSKGKTIKISYLVYSFEHSVRSNFLDTEYGFINPPALFLYPQDDIFRANVEIELETSPFFKYVYSPLPKNKKGNFVAKDFDELYDSPFQISNQKSMVFESQGCSHEIIIEGRKYPDIEENLISDLKKIISFETKLMGDMPNKYYLFILNLTENIYGGLEHSACSVNSFDPMKLTLKEEYTKLMGLLAHEYFHLWNIKRIRPIALGPFDYTSPNLTRDLWMAEGITSFYDNYTLLKTKVYTPEEYLEEIKNDWSKLERVCGEDWMSMEESSFTAWNKFYKQNSNSHNTGISYYTKGAILTLCMDLFIRKRTDCKKSFIDIMRLLYKKYYISLNRGFTKEEFFQTSTEATNVDLAKEFDIYLTKRKTIPLMDYLQIIGVQIIESEIASDLSFSTKTVSGKEVICKIYEHKNAGLVDINLNDELIAIDGYRINAQNLESVKKQIKPNVDVQLLLARRGIIIQRTIKSETTFMKKKLQFMKDIDEETLKFRKNFFEGEI